MATYLRSYCHPRRRRTAEYHYDELDADRRSTRHIEMRADDGTFLAAGAVAEIRAAKESGGPQEVARYVARYGVVPEAPFPQPSSDVQEMTAQDFDELWRRARCQLEGAAEVQIHEVRPRVPDGLPVVVRCVGGLVRVGSRLDRIRETGEEIDLTVSRILRYDRDVEQISPIHTAILILSGAGCAGIRAGHHLDGRTA